ncbi:Indoleamine 2,3-dioxygenase [Crepidotus variabilis]|uniref:Indoleamine 2,3-dioxygenase n=1 Tax=Crepidotus variabilis TaxID=179855 RepID=A0A9P6ERW5_9AGAR|nr:Indoleamine 2,3-dioxygenase [Crepidotus variabilis]
MNSLGDAHFLSLPRPDILVGVPAGVADTTTLAAHDFDVDTRTGFMPPQGPLSRLPNFWESWEKALDLAMSSGLQLGQKSGLTESDRTNSEAWRFTVRQLEILPIEDLIQSEIKLRRAHHVLAWIMHFYVHSLPPAEPIIIPAPISLPLLRVSRQLQLPPVLTYSDNVLYNWHLGGGKSDRLPTIHALRCQTLFTSTTDEDEFFLTSARMELVGVEALELMRSTMDEMFVGDDIAIRRITENLRALVPIIHRLRETLLQVKKGCKPQTFYHDIRPWFRGQDSQPGREWIFEGIEQDPTLVPPVELSGASAGQSALIHSLDIFLGIDKFSHRNDMTAKDIENAMAAEHRRAAFLERMQLYMPRHHRAFLNHLSSNRLRLREFVLSAVAGTLPEASSDDETSPKDKSALLEAYNMAVTALKELRDAHLIIVTLYIIGPARRGADPGSRATPDSKPTEETKAPLKGTGGTDLVRFLKGVRDQTKNALLPNST